jgi:hypothetical protein
MRRCAPILPLNQYTAAGTVDYQYDSSGNMTCDERFLYSYDPENRLTKVKKSGQCHRYYYGISQVPRP